jgi:hypothetical protein
MNRVSELLFFDPAISGMLTQLRSVRPGGEAIMLDPALPERRGPEAVHIVARGAPGQVNFAGDVWSETTLSDLGADFATKHVVTSDRVVVSHNVELTS